MDELHLEIRWLLTEALLLFLPQLRSVCGNLESQEKMRKDETTTSVRAEMVSSSFLMHQLLAHDGDYYLLSWALLCLLLEGSGLHQP